MTVVWPRSDMVFLGLGVGCVLVYWLMMITCLSYLNMLKLPDWNLMLLLRKVCVIIQTTVKVPIRAPF